MIRLFVSDIDGCLAAPYRSYDLDGFQTLARFVRETESPAQADRHPAISICSGRAYGYVEAVTQALGLTTPVIFESGGGMFDPVQARIAWNPKFTDAIAEQLEAVREWMVHTLMPGSNMSLDHGKRTQVGLVSPDEAEIAAHIPEVERFVEAHAPDLYVFPTHISIDVVHPDITKREGLEWLGRHVGVALDTMAYIGDTKGDLVALDAVGHSFAPANAQEIVRERVDIVTSGAVMDGTLEAYRWCVAHNETHAPETL